MTLVLHPRAAPGDRLRVWLGVFQQTAAPALTWELDSAPAEPDAVRAISSVRTDEMLPAGSQPQDVSRAFAGVYEFSGLQPGSLHTVTVHVANRGTQSLQVRTLPAEVPAGPEQWFNVLLVSCFHQAEDRSGRAGTLVSQLKTTFKPDLTFMMGDQVYLDLPTLQRFPNNLAWLAQKFERDYMLNWWGPPGYGHILNIAPSVSIPDDHEYWNNFPHPATIIQNSWTERGRNRWRAAAEAMYRGFQLPYPAHLGEPFILDVPPVSFFLADMRHDRDFNLRHVMSESAHQRLEAWVAQAIAQQKFAVFVSGQSLFSDAAGPVWGALGDYQIPNYGDYTRLINTLSRLIDAGRPLVCVTGDVHWGRLAEARDNLTGRVAIREVISSPTSLVTFVGADQVNEVKARVRGLFGERDPWPRHPTASTPPHFFARSVLRGRLHCPEPPEEYRQRGNHVALLSFQQMGGGVDMRLSYWEIPLDGSMPPPRLLGPFSLRSMS